MHAAPRAYVRKLWDNVVGGIILTLLGVSVAGIENFLPEYHVRSHITLPGRVRQFNLPQHQFSFLATTGIRYTHIHTCMIVVAGCVPSCHPIFSAGGAIRSLSVCTVLLRAPAGSHRGRRGLVRRLFGAVGTYLAKVINTTTCKSFFLVFFKFVLHYYCCCILVVLIVVVRRFSIAHYYSPRSRIPVLSI